MLRETRDKNKRERRKRPIRFKGICEHADALGVHRNHLYMVLSGRRESASLMARYRALVKEES